MTLFDVTGEKLWRTRAAELANSMLDRFGRPDGLFSTALNEKDLLIPVADEGDLEILPAHRWQSISFSDCTELLTRHVISMLRPTRYAG
jgi:uncharacterized protein YyaL (SSP411 family)